jgi:hypothetical protein
MKLSTFRIVLLFVVLVVLAGISGGAFVKAQQQGGLGDETDRPASALSPKLPVQSLEAASIPISGPGDETARPVTDLPDKTLSLNKTTEIIPAAVPAVPGADMAVPGAPNAAWKWFTTAGAVFMPWSNTMQWTYGGTGCLQPTTTGFWRAGVNIPDGSTLKQVYFGFYNSGVSTPSTANLYRYTYTGSAVQIATVNSVAGTTYTGYSYTGVLISGTVTVDNLNNAYVFTWSGSENQQLCYIQVGYIPPSIFGLALPVIVK